MINSCILKKKKKICSWVWVEGSCEALERLEITGFGKNGNSGVPV